MPEAIEPLHASCVSRTSHMLLRRLGNRATVRVRSPIVLGRYSEPEPDIAVVTTRDDFYVTAHPRPRDTLLGIEFVARNGSYDRTLKLPLYAKAELREVWLVDLTTATVEVHRRPALRGYRSSETYGRGQAIRPVAFPRMRVRVNEILG